MLKTGTKNVTVIAMVGLILSANPKNKIFAIAVDKTPSPMTPNKARTVILSKSNVRLAGTNSNKNEINKLQKVTVKGCRPCA